MLYKGTTKRNGRLAVFIPESIRVSVYQFVSECELSLGKN